MEAGGSSWCLPACGKKGGIMAETNHDKGREFVNVILVVILIVIVIGAGAFFVFRSITSGFTSKTEQAGAIKQETKQLQFVQTARVGEKVIAENKKPVAKLSTDSEESGETLDGISEIELNMKYVEFEYGLSEKTSTIDKITLPKTPIKLNSRDFSGFSIMGNILETNMFSLKIPDGWEACNAGDCIFMYDNRHQSERLYLFTLKSVMMTTDDYGAFLDKVFGNHSGFKSYDINGNEYVLSEVTKGRKTLQTLLKPLDTSFGLMFQCHSSTNRLTSWQKEIIESLRLKPVKETRQTKPKSGS